MNRKDIFLENEYKFSIIKILTVSFVVFIKGKRNILVKKFFCFFSII